MAEHGLSSGVVIAIAVLGFFILIVIVLFFILCLCKGKFKFLNFDKISAEESSHKSRFGEAKIDFVTKKLNKVRSQRGAPPIYDKPPQYQHHIHRGRYHDNPSYYDDEITPRRGRYLESIPSHYRHYPRDNESYAPSIQLRRYEESVVDGYTIKKSRRLQPLDGTRTVDSMVKSKSKKKRRSQKESSKPLKKKESHEFDVSVQADVPLNEMPDNSKLRDAGWPNEVAKPVENAKPEINPNAFSDSEASDDINMKLRMNKNSVDV